MKTLCMTCLYWLSIMPAAFAASVADLGERPIPFAGLRSVFSPVSVVVQTRSDCRELDVLLADTAAERARGLMFVTTMPDNAGMLFFYPEPREMSMWMKNTLIGLDLIFVSLDGTIQRITPRAEPMTLDSRAAGSLVQYVLELNAGMADQLGIAAGQRLFVGPH
ncbi:MAG: DUF192 domain-containing protein [Pseudomonadota bacterium]